MSRLFQGHSDYWVTFKYYDLEYTLTAEELYQEFKRRLEEDLAKDDDQD